MSAIKVFKKIEKEQAKQEAKRMRAEAKQEAKQEAKRMKEKFRFAKKAKKEQAKVLKQEAKAVKREARKAGLPELLVTVDATDRRLIRQAMGKLMSPDTVPLAALNDHFDLLCHTNVVKQAQFARTTGRPKLKRVLTKKGREVFKHFYPKKEAPQTPAVM